MVELGLDISGIRPKDVITNNAAKTTDGIGVFMERFSNTCREVAQNGRRGAEMITISVNHPEIETFINIKRNLTKVTGANISIRFNDEFMTAVKADQEYTLRWPVDAYHTRSQGYQDDQSQRDLGSNHRLCLDIRRAGSFVLGHRQSNILHLISTMSLVIILFPLIHVAKLYYLHTMLVDC